nr:hypothetical protein [Tanacetum cinerariifolium]
SDEGEEDADEDKYGDERDDDEENQETAKLKSLEASFSEYRQINPFAEAVSNIPVAADLSEMELKKILIEKMEGNKSI